MIFQYISCFLSLSPLKKGPRLEPGAASNGSSRPRLHHMTMRVALLALARLPERPNPRARAYDSPNGLGGPQRKHRKGTKGHLKPSETH